MQYATELSSRLNVIWWTYLFGVCSPLSLNTTPHVATAQRMYDPCKLGVLLQKMSLAGCHQVYGWQASSAHLDDTFSSNHEMHDRVPWRSLLWRRTPCQRSDTHSQCRRCCGIRANSSTNNWVTFLDRSISIAPIHTFRRWLKQLPATWKIEWKHIYF